MLRLDLKKTFGDFALDVNVEIPDGLIALFGPSGAGKTTALHAIAGLITPDSGEVCLNNVMLFSSSAKINVPTHRREIGCVFQESRLFPHLNVSENLAFARQQPSSQKVDIDEIIEALELRNLLKRKPLTCSAGEQQRIALGRALLASPKYLLMDEPLAAVDVPERWRILAALRELHHRHELPVLYVSHDPGTVLNFAERMVLLRDGQIEASGDPLSLFRRFVEDRRHPVIENTFAAVVSRHGSGYSEVRIGKLSMQTPVLQTSDGAVLPVGSKLFVQIPASEILLATTRPVGLSARNIFPGIISNLQSLENIVLVEADVGEKIVAEVLPTTVESLGLKTGATVFVIIKASGVRRV